MGIIRIFFIAAIASMYLFAAPVDVSIKGTVNDGTTGIEGAGIYLQSSPTLKTTSGADGTFELKGQLEQVAVAPFNISLKRVHPFGVKGNSVHFTIATPSKHGSISFFTGNGRRLITIPLGQSDAGNHQVDVPSLAAGLYFMHITIDGIPTVCKLVAAGSGIFVSEKDFNRSTTEGLTTTAAATAIDSLVAEKSGFATKKVAIYNYQAENIEIMLAKEETIPCPDFKVPAISELKANSKLPDLFKFIDGTRISRKTDWPCLRKQLLALLTYSHGDLPKDPGTVTATYTAGTTSGTLSITCKVGSKSESFNVTIKNIPSGDGPHPAILTFGGSKIPIPPGIAEIIYPFSTIAAEKARTGVFSRLFGTNTTAGSTVMWAWGVGRVIDALEQPTGHKINPKRIGVTGCSRNGKGALVCGAYEERIALTLPMEGGSGATSSWRISIAETDRRTRENVPGDKCQTPSHIANESGWLSPQFNQFASGDINKLPTDAHTLMAVCAPRGLYSVEGSQNGWNCNVANWTSATAARMIYEVLGVKENIGHVMNDHSHCNMSGDYGPDEKEAWNAFCKKFLLGDETIRTDYFKNDGSFDKQIKLESWIDWTAPTLE